jgi:hypothetical protein
VAAFYWLAGVENGSAHLFTPSSAHFVYITKPGRFAKPGSPGIFQREHVTTAFYTRSGGLRKELDFFWSSTQFAMYCIYSTCTLPVFRSESRSSYSSFTFEGLSAQERKNHGARSIVL